MYCSTNGSCQLDSPEIHVSPQTAASPESAQWALKSKRTRIKKTRVPDTHRLLGSPA